MLWYVFSLGRLWSVFHLSREVMGFIYPIWESLLCCGICIGLLVLFREKLNVQGRWGRMMAENQYAAYLFHVPVVILIQLAVAGACSVAVHQVRSRDGRGRAAHVPAQRRGPDARAREEDPIASRLARRP